MEMKSLSLYVVIAFSGMIFGAEIVASHVTQSLVLLVSAYHMLYNVLSLLLLVISNKMSQGKTLKNTFGWARVKVVGMMVNMLFLSALCFAATVESVQTVVHASHENTEPRHPMLILYLGIINFVLNIVCFILIRGYTHHQGCSMIIQTNHIKLNYVLADGDDKQDNAQNNLAPSCANSVERCPEDIPQAKITGSHRVLDLTRDLSSCLAVIACALIVILLDGLILKYVDAILAVASVVVLFATTYPFIRESGLILLQSIPNNMDIDGLAMKLQKKFPTVLSVHDLHVWRLTAAEVIATVHVIISDPATYLPMAAQLKEFFEEEGISSVTIQPEFATEACSENNVCILRCSSNNNCEALTCCGHLSDSESSPCSTRLQCTAKNARDSEDKQEVMPMLSTDISQTETLRCTAKTTTVEYNFESITMAIETNV